MSNLLRKSAYKARGSLYALFDFTTNTQAVLMPSKCYLCTNVLSALPVRIVSLYKGCWSREPQSYYYTVIRIALPHRDRSFVVSSQGFMRYVGVIHQSPSQWVKHGVMRIRRDTFGNPRIQKVLQNQPSLLIMSVILVGFWYTASIQNMLRI